MAYFKTPRRIFAGVQPVTGFLEHLRKVRHVRLRHSPAIEFVEYTGFVLDR
jgi:hypothetical protein